MFKEAGNSERTGEAKIYTAHIGYKRSKRGVSDLKVDAFRTPPVTAAPPCSSLAAFLEPTIERWGGCVLHCLVLMLFLILWQ